MSMTDEAFEAIVQQLQGQVFDDAREAYGDKGFERWRNPRFNGPIADADADASGGVKGGCGDTINIYLKFNGEKVAKAGYTTDGCGSSALCGSFTAELAHGKNPEELLELTPENVLNTIGRFPDEETHCATLAISALQEAVNNYMISVADKERKKQS